MKSVNLVCKVYKNYIMKILQKILLNFQLLFDGRV